MEDRVPHEPASEIKKLEFPDHDLIGILCGEQNAHLKILEKKIGVSIHSRGNSLTLKGGSWEIDLAESVLAQLYKLIEHEYPIYATDVQ